jgi:hypothetical protein
MATSKRRLDFFMRKQQWLDALSISLKKDHFTAHVAMVLAKHMNSDTGETFVGRETISDLVGGHVRTVERSIQLLEAMKFVSVRRSRGRGHANTYVMTFPEKAVSTPPFAEEKAAPTPPFSEEEKAVCEDVKGGLGDAKRRSGDRPNLQVEPKDIILGENGIEKFDVATSSVTPQTGRVASAGAVRRMDSQDRPKTFKNRGEFEQRIAELITEAGGDGWDVVMSLDEFKVAALCRRLKNGVLTQQEINDECVAYRRRSAARAVAS